MVAAASPQDIRTILNYYDASSGDRHFPGTVGELRRQHVPVEVTINDMRCSGQEFSLDRQGFQVLTSESAEKSFDNDVRIKDIYYKECSDLVKSITGASKAIPFAHIVRRQSHEAAKDAEKDKPDDARSGEPTTAGFVHIDNSYQGAFDRISRAFPDEVEKMKRGVRWGIINVWRPINPVTRNPLAMADARSVGEDELKEIITVFPKAAVSSDDNKENQAPKVDYYGVQRQEAGLWQVWPPADPSQHKWWYTSNMQPNEALLLKIFDSKESGVARRSPHTSFSSDLDHGPARQSLEVRLFVMWE